MKIVPMSRTSMPALAIRRATPSPASMTLDPIAQIFNGHDIGTGLIYQDPNIKVSAVQNSHFDFHKGSATGKHKSYSYRFEMSDRVIVFTGDTGVSEWDEHFCR